MALYPVEANVETISMILNIASVAIGAVSAYLTYVGVVVARRCFRKDHDADTGS